MAIKSKKNTTTNTKATTKTTATKSKSKDLEKQIEEKREQIVTLNEEIKSLLAQLLSSERTGGFTVGDTIYYPAPPQKKPIACRLELEEDGNGNIVFFARPLCKAKDGSTVLSKRHYNLGTDLSNNSDITTEPPKEEKKPKAAKKSKPIPDNSAVVEKPTKKSAPTPPAKKMKLGGKKLGRK